MTIYSFILLVFVGIFIASLSKKKKSEHYMCGEKFDFGELELGKFFNTVKSSLGIKKLLYASRGELSLYILFILLFLTAVFVMVKWGWLFG